MGHAHPSPSAGNGHENLRLFRNELRLLLRREHQVAVALFLRGERSEDPAPDTEVGRSHMRAFFRAFQAPCNPAKICCIHRAPLRSSVWTSRIDPTLYPLDCSFIQERATLWHLLWQTRSK